MNIIREQHTEENPLIIKNYPYGFKKCIIKMYIETKRGKGQRFCSQTQNPKTLIWNKVKKGTYHPLVVLYKDEKEHTHNLSLSPYMDKESLKEFLDKVGDYPFNDYQIELLNYLKKRFDLK